MPDAGVPPLLEVRIRRKAHHGPGGAVEAVADLALSIGEGEFVCLIGPSGCGKTTTLRVLLGLDRDFDGTLSPDPQGIAIGMAFQEPRLLPWRTVEQNIRLALPKARRGQKLDTLFAELGLAEWRERYPGELSLGLARRASLARALVGDPRLLVLDEPFVSLDDRSVAALHEVLLAAAARRGASVLMVTHNLREALALADRLVLLTARPARVRAEIRLDLPRAARSAAWIEQQHGLLAAMAPAA